MMMALIAVLVLIDTFRDTRRELCRTEMSVDWNAEGMHR